MAVPESARDVAASDHDVSEQRYRISEEQHTVVDDIHEQRFVAASQLLQPRAVDHDRLQPITRPTTNVLDELMHLSFPRRIVDYARVGNDEEDVDVTRFIGLTTREGAEKTGVDRQRIPLTQGPSQPGQDNSSTLESGEHTRREHVIAVEPIEMTPGRRLGEHQAVSDETIQNRSLTGTCTPASQPGYLRGTQG